MTSIARLLAGSALVLLPLLVQAGSTPAGGGTTAVGSTVMPLTYGMPGYGVLTVPAQQAAQIARTLLMLPGTQTNESGTYVRADITLDDGRPAVITVNTETGQVSVSRK